jgi:hypothetical protein
MRDLIATIVAIAFVCIGASIAPAHAQSSSADTASSGVRDFDFEFGDWTVHHRIKRASNQQWFEFDGVCTARPLMDGAMNVEDHTFDRPDGVTRGVALRAYDAKTGQWAIWWVDSRNPHGTMDPPMIGRFEKGVGTFYSEGVVNGKTLRTRFLWSQITPTSAHWEQASSADAGKTWDTNWIMDFRRAPQRSAQE